jgi:hypothetical protein
MDQSQSSPQLPQPRPKNWLVESILVTIFCCLPFGIVGIVNAASVNSKFNAGDYTGALESSKNAGKWTKTGFWIGLVFGIACAVFLYVNRNNGGFGMPG